MSYILDAIKKSDQQRELGTTPDVHTVHETPEPEPPRRPTLLYGLAAFLILNAGGIGWMLVSGGAGKVPFLSQGEKAIVAGDQAKGASKTGQTTPPPPPAKSAQVPAPPAGQVATVPVPPPPPMPAPSVSAGVSQAEGTSAPPTSSLTMVPPPPPQTAQSAVPVMAPRPATPPPLPASTPVPPAAQAPAVPAAAGAKPAVPASQPAMPAASAADTAAKDQAVSASPPLAEPSDSDEITEEPLNAEEPAVKAQAAEAPGETLKPIAATAGGKEKGKRRERESDDPELAKVPLPSQLPQEVQQSLPEMHISFHSYSIKPASRLVSISGKILREGDELDEGLKLETITKQGVIMVVKDRRFRLQVNPSSRL